MIRWRSDQGMLEVTVRYNKITRLGKLVGELVPQDEPLPLNGVKYLDI